MPRKLTAQTLENAAMRTLYLIVKGVLTGPDAQLRIKAATSILQVQKKLGTRSSPIPDEPIGEPEDDVPELKGMSDRELRDMLGEE